MPPDFCMYLFVANEKTRVMAFQADAVDTESAQSRNRPRYFHADKLIDAVSLCFLPL